jgi:hypothetical protein
MATTKRTPVPKVEKPKAPPIPEAEETSEPEETTQVESDTTNTNEGNTTMKPSSFFKKAITVVSNNRETIKRKAIVAVGTGVGMLIASAVTDAFNRRGDWAHDPHNGTYVPIGEETIGEEAGWGPSDRVVHIDTEHVPTASEIAAEVVKKTRTPRAKAVPVVPTDDEVEGPNADE